MEDKAIEKVASIMEPMLEHLSKNMPSRQDLEVCLELLERAKGDSDACKLLYAKPDYASSTYNLQQCFEKTTKAVGVSFSLIRVSDFKRKIGHQPLRMFVDLLKQDFIPPIRDLLDESAPNRPKENIGELESLLSNKKKKEIAKASFNELTAVFSICDQIDNGLRERFDSLITSDGDNPMKDLFFLPLTDFMFLFCLSAYIWPHEESTRYPGGDIRPRDYSSEVGIVRATPQFLERLDAINDHFVKRISNQLSSFIGDESENSSV